MARYFYIPSETKLGKGFQRTKKYSNFAFGKFIFFATNLPGGRQGHEDTKDFFCEKIKKNEACPDDQSDRFFTLCLRVFVARLLFGSGLSRLGKQKLEAT